MRTNTDCTVINMAEINGKEQFFFTYLAAVFWEPRQARNINTSGISNADSLRVYIPFNVNSSGKAFALPKGFERSQEGFWTLSGGNTWIVKGKLNTSDMKEITRLDGSFKITTVDTKDFGSPAMRHWEVGAK